MTAKSQNISVYENTATTIEITVTDSKTGDPAPMTGATAILWRVSTGPDSETSIIEKTLAAGEISLGNEDGTDDRIDIDLDATDTDDLGGNVYYHECRVTDASAEPFVVSAGRFEIERSNTG